MTAARREALAIFDAALAALDPRGLARAAAATRLAGAGAPVELWAVGKAAAAMAAGVRDAVAVREALVVAKDGPGATHAGHPLPDARSLAAGERLLARAAALAQDDVAVLALSGGASALAVAPAPGVSLDDKVAATRAVAASGATIAELNAVRKHLSRLKGGRLAAATRARVVALLLSDVCGDDVSVIGSGPVCADDSTFAEALAIARRAGSVPAAALAALEAGARGEREETLRPGDARLARVEVQLLAGPHDLARAAAAAARARGRAVTVEPLATGPVEELAARLAERAASQPAGHATVIAGEPTVRLPAAPGRGGRAQHTALLVARALSDPHGRGPPTPTTAEGGSPAGIRLARRSPGDGELAVLCIASDGSDGPTADAGGLVTSQTLAWARAHRDELERAIAGHDAGPALAASGSLITTGPTGTNLTDLYLVLT